MEVLCFPVSRSEGWMGKGRVLSRPNYFIATPLPGAAGAGIFYYCGQKACNALFNLASCFLGIKTSDQSL